MPIMVHCSCGKRMGVSDKLAGKTIKCPACGDPLEVAQSAAPAAATGGKKGPKQPKASSAIYVSKAQVIFSSTVVILAIIVLVIWAGPVRAWNKWDSMRGQANDDVSDVISYGLQAYLSQQGFFDPKHSRGTPAVQDGVHFFWPTLVMSMPEKIHFLGATSMGPFNGYYFPNTGEISADVHFGGMSLIGTVTATQAAAVFHMTGRMQNGFPQAEMNGVPLKIVSPSDSGN